MGLHSAGEKIGCMVFPTAPLDTLTRIKLIQEHNITAIACTPTYALRMATVAEENGISLENTDVNIIITSGKPRPQSTKKRIQELWNAHNGDTAGMAEAGTIFTFECAEQPGGIHIIEDHFIEKVIDPESREQVDYGEKGVRIMISLVREGIPILR